MEGTDKILDYLVILDYNGAPSVCQPTDAQIIAFRELQARSGIPFDKLAHTSRFDLVCWKPGQSATLMVPFHGMLVGIEPDGYTHS